MRRILSLVIMAMFVLAACSAGDKAVARVGDTQITIGDISGLYQDLDVLPIDDSFRSTLFRMMALRALEDGYRAEFGVGLDEGAVDERFAELAAIMEENQLTPDQFLEVADASMDMVRFNARILVLRDAVTSSLVTDDLIQSLFDDPVGITTVCARHILVATEEEALAVMDRLAAGEDFGVVADEVSLDSAIKGDLQCRDASGYVPEFAQAAVEAPIDEVVGPVQTDFGFHVIQVYDRSAPTIDEVRADPVGYLPAADLDFLWTNWFNDLLGAADAEVLDAKYGSWTPTGIVPADDGSGG